MIFLLFRALRPWGSGKNVLVIKKSLLTLIDTNARAYGHEVGSKGKALEPFLELSPDNPFKNPNWRKNV